MITVTQNIKNIEITVTQDGNEIKLQPIITTVGEAFDGIIDGGTP